jgi:predicted nucleic acid-binding protein
MIVVADSGPLLYLILLEQVELLRRFYGQVLVPEPVASELSGAGAPEVVREWVRVLARRRQSAQKAEPLRFVSRGGEDRTT